jgi:hypothetical protein
MKSILLFDDTSDVKFNRELFMDLFSEDPNIYCKIEKDNLGKITKLALETKLVPSFSKL